MNLDRHEALIGGTWVPAGKVIDVDNPATGERIGSGAASDQQLVEDAVVAAAAAQRQWAALSPVQRADQLDNLLAALRARRDALVDITVAEVGVAVNIARPWHIDVALDIIASAAHHARNFDFQQEVGHSLLLRRPAGVVGAITPWNYPFYQLAGKVGSALAAGCTFVHKPAELTPLSAYMFAEATIEAGLPAGVFNLVPGSGQEAGAALAAHPRLDVMSFTGSTAVGSTAGAAAMANLTRVCLELGGKSSSIVCADAQFAAAVRATVDSCMLNSGQSCDAWSRLLVPQERYEEALEIAGAYASSLVVGDPASEETDLGPVITASQRDKIAETVSQAIQRGARVITGGPTREHGNFVTPTVLADLPVTDPASQHEIFGPVLIVHPYRDEDEAIEIANNTAYGLGGSVWAGSTERALAIAAHMNTGQVDLNGADFNVEAPFGGWKQSGIGREFGIEGLLEFTELTSVQR